MKKPTIIAPGAKWCTKCKSVRGNHAFSTDASRPDGLRRWCKGCDNEATRIRQTASYWTPERLAKRDARNAVIASIAAQRAASLHAHA